MVLEAFIPAVAGGILIGLASLTLLLFNGKVAGVSGIVGGLFAPTTGDTGWRVAFAVGLLLGGVGLLIQMPASLTGDSPRSLPLLALGGLLVGFGSRLGSGCTSGHGVCGVGRLSKRSITATLLFTLAGAAAVFILRMVGGA